MFLKKPLSLLLAFFLLLSQFGFAFQVHYCGDSIASVQLNALATTQNVEDDCCGIVEKESSCCNDKTIQLSKKSDTFVPIQHATTSAILVVTIPTTTNWYWPSFCSVVTPSISTYYWESHAPPLFKLYSQFIYYDKV
jgi:hypothetical protein